MRDSLRNIYLYFQRSFIEEFHFYLLYTVLYCLPYIIGNICSEECSLKFVVWEFLHDFVICNVSFLLICILPNRGRVIACRVLATLVLVNFFVESSCLIGIHSIFTDDMVSIIMATNIGESKEFISTYFSFKVAIAWSIAALFYIIVLKKKVFPNKIARYVANIILTILCLCVLYFEYKGTESYNPKLYRKVSFFKNFEAPPDLRHYQERVPVILFFITDIVRVIYFQDEKRE